MSKIVERTLDLFELFAREKRPLSLSDMARLLKIPMSSCHDVTRAMQARGYLYELAPRGGYYPTLRLQSLGKEIGDNDPVLARADIQLRCLRDTLNESVLLSKVSGLSATYLLVFDPGQPLRVLYRVGDGIGSLHGTSAGKALLGSLGDRALDAFLKSAKLLPITERTITSKAALRKEIELGKERGWFLNRGETLNDVMSVSSPFRWNSAIYIVTVAGPSSRLDGRLEEVVPLLTGVCRRLEMGPDVK